MQRGKLICTLLILAVVGGAAQARAKVVEDVSGSLKTLTSIGDALDSPDHHPVHILYIHGIDAVGAGGSVLLRQSICTKLKLCAVKDWKNAGVEFPDKGEFADGVEPPKLNYLGSPVWENAEEWHDSAPFVVHWVAHLRGHPSILVVDEINWWPLTLALKCRRVVAPEAYLAGPYGFLLQFCSDQKAQAPNGMGRFYPWIKADEAAELEMIQPRGVRINRSLKDDIVDWGLTDVLLTTGQLGGILRDGVRQLMAKSAAFDPRDASDSPETSDRRERYKWWEQLRSDNTMDQEFVGVTHSLGSYLFFNTLNPEPSGAAFPSQTAQDAAWQTDENEAVRYIFERMSLVHFLANQLELLEITNLEITQQTPSAAIQPRGLAPPPAPVTPAADFRSLVNRWKQMQTKFQAALHPNDEAARRKVQVVAWSDPSDVITFRVPDIGDVNVVNLYVQNARRWFGLFEAPDGAHCDYAKNKDVLRVMFENTKHRGRD
jgi:hypothetical protein